MLAAAAYTPGVAVVPPSVFVTARSATTATVSVSVALLLPGVGSVTPPGVVTVAVLDNVPVAAAEIVHDAVYVTEPPTGKLAASLMLPEPLAVQMPPPAPTHVHVHVKDAGNVSAIVEPGASLGPALLAVIVYVVEPPMRDKGVSCVTVHAAICTWRHRRHSVSLGDRQIGQWRQSVCIGCAVVARCWVSHG